MDKRYWNDAANRYDHDILDSLHTDRRGIIKRRLRSLADDNHIAADFGCGVGKYLPTLARSFKHVYAIDHARKLLDVAERQCASHDNITFIESDLARRSITMRRAHVALCMNVLIMPDAKRRAAILANVHRHMVRGGRLLLLVASMESALWANCRLLEWNRRAGVSRAAARREGIAPTHDALEGVIDREGVPHKHYLREELITELQHAGFTPQRIDRVEYPWDTEFNDPPQWMGEPYPWDWLVTAWKK